MEIVPTEPAMTEVMRELYDTSYIMRGISHRCGIENFMWSKPSPVCDDPLYERTLPEVTLLGRVLIETAEVERC